MNEGFHFVGGRQQKSLLHTAQGAGKLRAASAAGVAALAAGRAASWLCGVRTHDTGTQAAGVTDLLLPCGLVAVVWRVEWQLLGACWAAPAAGQFPRGAAVGAASARSRACRCELVVPSAVSLWACRCEVVVSSAVCAASGLLVVFEEVVSAVESWP